MVEMGAVPAADAVRHVATPGAGTARAFQTAVTSRIAAPAVLTTRRRVHAISVAHDLPGRARADPGAARAPPGARQSAAATIGRTRPRVDTAPATNSRPRRTAENARARAAHLAGAACRCTRTAMGRIRAGVHADTAAELLSSRARTGAVGAHGSAVANDTAVATIGMVRGKVRAAATAGATTCVLGVCSCAAGLDLCSGACVDTYNDPRNCGGCGTATPARSQSVRTPARNQ